MSLPEILSCNWEKNSKYSWKIRYPGNNFLIFLGYWGVPLWCFLGKWWHSPLSLMIWQAGIFKALVNRGVLLNNWIFWKKQLFFIYYLHQNTWITKWITKMTWEKKSVFCKNNLSSRTGQPMSTIWKPCKKDHLIFRSPPSGCFWLKLIHTLKLSYNISKE